MNSKLAFVLGLVAGGAAGAFVSWRILKAKYKKIADEEIESVKEVLTKRAAEQAEKKIEEPAEDKDELREAYVAITKTYTNGEELGTSEDQKPYTISPDDFGEREDYDEYTLVYYADNVLTYNSGEVVENVRAEVGTDFMNHFGDDENDPDTVYIRNDVLKNDYEILRDSAKFSDVMRHVYQCNSLPIDTEE